LPGTATALDRAGLTAGRDYRAVFASIDPREDPATMQEAVERIPAADRAGWRFLGGDDASVRTLARTVGFHYRYEPDHDAYAHPEGIVILSPGGLVSRYFFGASFDPGALKQALADAGQGQRGGIAQQLLLLCYHFDPSTGRYTPRILVMMRLLIGLCAVGATVYALRLARGRRNRGGAA
jgi:protein SCO1/2